MRTLSVDQSDRFISQNVILKALPSLHLASSSKGMEDLEHAQKHSEWLITTAEKCLAQCNTSHSTWSLTKVELWFARLVFETANFSAMTLSKSLIMIPHRNKADSLNSRYSTSKWTPSEMPIASSTFR
jgi:hypothetical protein